MMPDEEELFAREMGDVVRHTPAEKVVLNRQNDSESTLEERRRAAAEEKVDDRNSLAEHGVLPLDPWFVLDFKRPGVQNGVFRKLKQGKYEPEARLDMHRMTVEHARRELFEYVEESVRLGLRTVMVIHGKGESRADRERSSILKGCTHHWLQQLDDVMAFHSARPNQGGTGAVVVLLRKSEEQKRRNREVFRKGRISVD